MSRFIAEAYANHGSVEGTLEVVFRRYFELRAEMALANMRLVAYVAKRYRNRGIAYLKLLSQWQGRPPSTCSSIFGQLAAIRSGVSSFETLLAVPLSRDETF